MLELLGVLFQKDMIPQVYMSVLSSLYAEFQHFGTKRLDLKAYQEKYEIQKKDLTEKTEVINDKVSSLFEQKIQNKVGGG